MLFIEYKTDDIITAGGVEKLLKSKLSQKNPDLDTDSTKCIWG